MSRGIDSCNYGGEMAKVAHRIAMYASVAFHLLHVVNACRRCVAHQAIVLSRPELSLLVEFVSTLRHLFNLGKVKLLLAHKVVDGLGILRGDVVDLSQILFLYNIQRFVSREQIISEDLIPE